MTTGFRPSVPLALALLAAAAILPACAANPRDGYSFASSFREDIASVQVPLFKNDTFAHGIEADLAEAIVNEIRTSTPWKVVQSPQAQTVLSGSIVSAELSPRSIARDSGMVEELAYTLTVDFTWRDNRTGKTLIARRAFRAAEPFVPARGTNERINEKIEVGQAGAAQELARRIVAELRSSW